MKTTKIKAFPKRTPESTTRMYMLTKQVHVMKTALKTKGFPKRTQGVIYSGTTSRQDYFHQFISDMDNLKKPKEIFVFTRTRRIKHTTKTILPIRSGQKQLINTNYYIYFMLFLLILSCPLTICIF